MNDSSSVPRTGNDIKTYRKIRRAIGYLGISLPIVLVILSFIPFFKTPVQPSISDYYYTNLREFFTGVLCAVGLFLIRYEGTRNPRFFKNDDLLTNISGYMAFGIAFFPTNPENWAEKIYTLVPLHLNFLGYVHYGFAALFFIILSIISFNVFTIGQQKNEAIRVSIFNENRIYRTFGFLMLFFIAMIPVFAIFHVLKHSTLLFEMLALFSFGISWLIKGRALGDKGRVGEKIYREVN